MIEFRERNSERLKLHFLLRWYQLQFFSKIQDRLEKNEKPYTKYVTILIILMCQIEGYSIEQKVEKLYNNMHMKYQMQLVRTIFGLKNLLKNDPCHSEFEQI